MLFSIFFVTDTVIFPINGLYPVGADVSVIIIVSVVLGSVISTVPKFNTPLLVVPVCSLCPGNVQLNPAPDEVIKFPSSSTFCNCNW